MSKELTVADKKAMVGSVPAFDRFWKQNAKLMLAALPDHIKPAKFISNMVTEIRNNPNLLNCNADTVVNAVQQAASLGLQINGILGHAYLVKFGTNCTLIPGYKGYIDMARRSGEISSITLEVVRKGDTFEYRLGDDAHITHVPNQAPDADMSDDSITHAYCSIRLKDGGRQRKVWTRAKLLAHRDKHSRSYQNAEKKDTRDSIWHLHFEVMCKKTVVRDMAARGELPLSAEMMRMAVADEMHEQQPVLGGEFVDSTPKLTDVTKRLKHENTEAGEDAEEVRDPPAGGSPPDETEWETQLRARYDACKTTKEAQKIRDANLADQEMLPDDLAFIKRAFSEWLEAHPPKGSKTSQQQLPE